MHLSDTFESSPKKRWKDIDNLDKENVHFGTFWEFNYQHQQKDFFNGHNKNNNEIKLSIKSVTKVQAFLKPFVNYLKKVRQITIKDITKLMRLLWSILERDKNLEKS